LSASNRASVGKPRHAEFAEQIKLAFGLSVKAEALAYLLSRASRPLPEALPATSTSPEKASNDHSDG
jgi:hypothetical protein